MIITSFTASVVRAVIMGIILLGSKILFRKLDIYTSVAIAILIVLIENPFTIYNVGFQLSYIGTIGIVLFNNNIKKMIKIKSKIIDIFTISISAQMALIPIIILNFNTVSLTFLISNFLAMPILGLCTGVSFIAVVFSIVWFDLGKVIAIIANIFLEILIWIAEITSNAPLSNVYVTTPHITIILIYYIVIIFLNYLYSLFNIDVFYLKNYQKKIINMVKSVKPRQLVKLTLTVVVFIVLIFVLERISLNFKMYFVDVSQRRLYTYCNSQR